MTDLVIHKHANKCWVIKQSSGRKLFESVNNDVVAFQFAIDYVAKHGGKIKRRYDEWNLEEVTQR